MYDGKSIIICIAVVVVFLLAYLSFHAASICVGLVLLGKFHHHCDAINHGCSAFCLYQRNAMLSDPISVVGRRINGHNLSNTFSAMWKQCFTSTECLQMDRKN
jgi:hypothetical protein